MKDAKTAVLFDLDSTLCRTQQRWHLSPLHNPEASSWEDYAAACEGDEPAWGIVRAMELHYGHSQVHICSNRPSSAMDQTRRWLVKYGIQWDEMVLAPPKLPEFGTDDEAILWLARRKIFYCKSLRLRGIEPVLFYEDQADIAQMILDQADVPCVIVNPVYKKDTWTMITGGRG